TRLVCLATTSQRPTLVDLSAERPLQRAWIHIFQVVADRRTSHSLAAPRALAASDGCGRSHRRQEQPRRLCPKAVWRLRGPYPTLVSGPCSLSEGKQIRLVA